MILDSQTVAKINRKDYSEKDLTYLDSTLLPSLFAFALQYTNRSWYNAENKPSDYTPQNPAIAPSKIPDDAVVALSKMADDFMSGTTRNIRRQQTGQVSIEYFASSEMKYRPEIAGALNNYVVPAI